MEKHGNKTIMCSVLFLDITEYSKKPVAGQISLKDRFNGYLSAAISNVPMTDRIILDTGDGAAINFLGDIEDALKAALSLRESILREDPDLDPPLRVRMGINLGPVRLVRDINGQPNIVGDGINVAQRIMGFAEAGQILVSRSYHDAVSRLSPAYTGIFRYQGSRTDKHVREHEIYEIGHPGDNAGQRVQEHHAGMSWHVKLDAAARGFVERLKQADSRQHAMYVAAMVVLPMLLVGILVLKLLPGSKAPALPGADQVQAERSIQPASGVAPVAPAVPPHAEGKTAGTADIQPGDVAKPQAKKPAEGKPDAKKSAEGRMESKKTGDQVKQPAAQYKAADSIRKGAAPASTNSSAGYITDSYISISCKEGTQLFMDSILKGKVIGKELTITVPPGKHTVIVSSVGGALHTQSVELEPGKTVHLKPNFCD